MSLDDIQIFPEIRLPVQCLAGMREELFLVGETEVARTVNGRSMVLSMPWGEKFGLRYVCDGDGRRLLPLDELKLGRRLIVHPATPRGRVIAPGATTVRLDRSPVPGSLHARDVDTDEPIDVSHVVVPGPRPTFPPTHEARIFGRGGWTQVSYRPVLTCLVTGIVGFGSDVTGRRQNATVELEEEFAP